MIPESTESGKRAPREPYTFATRDPGDEQALYREHLSLGGEPFAVEPVAPEAVAEPIPNTDPVETPTVAIEPTFAERLEMSTVMGRLNNKKIKGRCIVVPQWVRHFVMRDIREQSTKPQTFVGVANLYLVFSQMLYWYHDPKTKKPRAAGKNLRTIKGVSHVRLNSTRFAKDLGIGSRRAVESAAEKLREMGYIHLVTDEGRKYWRISVEYLLGIVKELEAVYGITPPGVSAPN